MVGCTWSNKLGTRGGRFSCFPSSSDDAHALVFLLDKDEPKGAAAESLLGFVSFALDALRLFAVDTREEAAVLITD